MASEVKPPLPMDSLKGLSIKQGSETWRLASAAGEFHAGAVRTVHLRVRSALKRIETPRGAASLAGFQRAFGEHRVVRGRVVANGVSAASAAGSAVHRAEGDGLKKVGRGYVFILYPLNHRFLPPII